MGDTPWLLEVGLHLGGGPLFGVGRVVAELGLGPALPQQVPGLVELDLELLLDRLRKTKTNYEFLTQVQQTATIRLDDEDDA